MIKEMLPEYILPEHADEFKHYYDDFKEDVIFVRCTCGSSTCKVIITHIIEEVKGKKFLAGIEYYIVCAKCGDCISGFTDIYSKEDAKTQTNILKEEIEKDLIPIKDLDGDD